MLDLQPFFLHVLLMYIIPVLHDVPAEALILLNHTLPSQKLLNPTLQNQETDKTESDKPHSAQPESDKLNLGIC